MQLVRTQRDVKAERAERIRSISQPVENQEFVCYERRGPRPP